MPPMSLIIVLILLKILNHVFDYKKKIRVHFKSTLHYQSFNTVIFILICITLVYFYGMIFFMHNLYYIILAAFFYINYLPKDLI